MPSATLDAIVFRSTNPVRRVMDVMCLVILQLLTLRFLANQSDTERRRNHPALGPHSILARLDAGETFDLPLPLIAFMRRTVSEFRTDLRLDSTDFQRSEPPSPTPPRKPASRRKARRRSAAPPCARRPRPNAPLRARRSPLQATAPPQADRGVSNQKALSCHVFPRPFRCGIGTILPALSVGASRPPPPIATASCRASAAGRGSACRWHCRPHWPPRRQRR
jgi:hypothetical protein